MTVVTEDKGRISINPSILYKDKLLFIIIIIITIIIIISGSAAQRGLWPPRQRGFLITNNDPPQLAGLLWTSDQLVAETST
jgi:hypothetical protein